jgi:hypothetical protein
MNKEKIWLKIIGMTKRQNEAIYTPHNEVVGGYTGFTMSVRL